MPPLHTYVDIHIASWDCKTGILLLVKYKVHILTYIITVQ